MSLIASVPVRYAGQQELKVMEPNIGRVQGAVYYLQGGRADDYVSRAIPLTMKEVAMLSQAQDAFDCSARVDLGVEKKSC
jgi:hypothetical protein